jgi:hypothetical protein
MVALTYKKHGWKREAQSTSLRAMTRLGCWDVGGECPGTYDESVGICRPRVHCRHCNGGCSLFLCPSYERYRGASVSSEMICTNYTIPTAPLTLEW